MAITVADKINKTPQEMQNLGFDTEFNVPAVELLGCDGQSVQRMVGDSLAIKVTVSGSITYVGLAAPGTSQSSANWQCKKVDESVSGTTVITWADGNGGFDNVATDLTALSYS
jgi:hypothetical protein